MAVTAFAQVTIIRLMPKWIPAPGSIATYIGRTRASTRTVRVIAEAVKGRMVVEAVGKKGLNVRFTVKQESLARPEPDLFD